MSYLAQAHYIRGDYGRSIALALDNLAALPAAWIYETFGNTAPISNERISVFNSLGELGRFDEAVPHETEALRIADVVHDAFSVGRAYTGSALLHVRSGRWATARSRLERGIAAYWAGNISLGLYPVTAH